MYGSQGSWTLMGVFSALPCLPCVPYKTDLTCGDPIIKMVRYRISQDREWDCTLLGVRKLRLVTWLPGFLKGRE
ncbi:hypothetical protein B0H66DRAFT_557431 [Apodospora peruviana]|uniref:Uncharacterized protein n=1 Tax=Apodospora peruviana TaxID=516989 RepID=A0AAE0I5D3_9PEZI|nr:hypothetical protein B0H66DRAFT_557431 [Apodospora peruviana]